MKVCMITSYPPSLNGVSSYSAKLCEAMLNADSDAQILVLSDEQPDTHLSNRINVLKVWDRRSFLYPLKLLKVLSRWKPHIVHFQHEYWLYGRHIYSITFPLSMLTLKLFRRPIVGTIHCVIPKGQLTKGFFKKHNLGESFALIKKLYVQLYTKLMGLIFSKVVTHSETARIILINDYGFKESKTLVIPHGVENLNGNPWSSQDMMKEKLGLSGNHILLFFGGVRHGKGIEHAIKAMPMVLDVYPSSLLVVAGIYDHNLSPESVGYLEELIALSKSMKLDGNVAFRTNIPDENIPAYFLVADISLFPYTEDDIVAASGPLSMAIAFGKPIIASNVERFKDVLRDKENAILVPPADAIGLAKAINTLLRSPELMRKLSQGVKLTVRGKNWENVALKTLNLYDELVAE